MTQKGDVKFIPVSRVFLPPCEGLTAACGSAGEDPRESRSALQLRPTLVRHRGLSGARPVPPIPRLASPLPDKMELIVTKRRNEECEDVWLSEADGKLAADLAELNVDDEEVDQEEVGLNMT